MAGSSTLTLRLRPLLLHRRELWRRTVLQSAVEDRSQQQPTYRWVVLAEYVTRTQQRELRHTFKRHREEGCALDYATLCHRERNGTEYL